MIQAVKILRLLNVAIPLRLDQVESVVVAKILLGMA